MIAHTADTEKLEVLFARRTGARKESSLTFKWPGLNFDPAAREIRAHKIGRATLLAWERIGKEGSQLALLAMARVCE